MKNKSSKHQNGKVETENQKTAAREVNPGEVAAAARWWGALKPGDKIAAFEVGVIAQALRGGRGHEVLVGEVKLKRAYEAFARELGDAFELRPEVFMPFYDPRPELPNGGFVTIGFRD